MNKINWFLVIAAVALVVMMCIWPFGIGPVVLMLIVGALAVLFGALMAKRLDYGDVLLWAALAVVLALVTLVLAAKAFLANGQNGGHAIGVVVILLVLFVATAISLVHQLGKHTHWYH